jgi:hypothetical protein
MLVPPPILTYVQTSGTIQKIHPRACSLGPGEERACSLGPGEERACSLGPEEARACVATIINAPSDIYRYTISVDAQTPTEAEWASVLFGLTMATERSCEAIIIENKNLGIIRSLMIPRPRFRYEYACHYHNQILAQAKETTWTGVRWQNHADTLLQ